MTEILRNNLEIGRHLKNVRDIKSAASASSLQ